MHARSILPQWRTMRASKTRPRGDGPGCISDGTARASPQPEPGFSGQAREWLHEGSGQEADTLLSAFPAQAGIRSRREAASCNPSAVRTLRRPPPSRGMRIERPRQDRPVQRAQLLVRPQQTQSLARAGCRFRDTSILHLRSREILFRSIPQEGCRDLFNGAGLMRVSVRVRGGPSPLRRIQTQRPARPRISRDRVRTARPARRNQTRSGRGQYRCSRQPTQHLPGTPDPRFPVPTGRSDQIGDANSRGASRVPGGPTPVSETQDHSIPGGSFRPESGALPFAPTCLYCSSHVRSAGLQLRKRNEANPCRTFNHCSA
jgi:hypothetical protein